MPRIKPPQDYRMRRLEHYPDEREQLGALMKIEAARLAGEEPPADAVAIVKAVAETKVRFPKAPGKRS